MRAAKTIADERMHILYQPETNSSGAVIQKESAAIRTSFREEPSGNIRQQNVLKLLYAVAFRSGLTAADISSLLGSEPISVKLNA